ncbi:hypothetical protein SETIT_4G233900v2 [Setaria italica]|uniref:Fanconi Anaemia group E protein C-terminal domain-containing protein n=1 Tax=Setaria italica TaxID=4555 RepID=K3Y1K2_SETIT|nr:uncharacterized protein LOC101766779 [Setaria italica]XP_022681443.1 uncharacterized protein LOC101766779 [Setaria italica]RCV22609.1 hypothetical protein SETIT_4G233900v2 [Setaria italica]
MEQWLPLFRHLLACPVPNAAAFSSSPSSGDCPGSPPPAAALLRLLLSPAPTLPASASDVPTGAILFQTLPPFLQSQALSFLASSADLLDTHLIRSLAARVLSAPPGRYGFWTCRGARHLLDGLPEEEGVPGVASEEFVNGFHEPPPWLKEVGARARPVLPWLPVDCRSVMGRGRRPRGGGDGLDGIELETLVLVQDEDVEMQEAGCIPLPQAPPLGDSIVQRALAVQKEIVMVESVLVAQRVVKDLQDLCVRSRNAAAVLSLVQPWEADDDTLRVLLSNLVLQEDGVRGGGPALVLCSVFLPQLLELQRPPSSVLLSAALDLCKRHPAAALEAVLFPLVLRKGGLNVPQCDVLTRIVKECMHPLHVSAFCHRLLSGEEQERKPVCMPQHHENVGTHLVWTESLFSLFYSILSQDICLTPSSVGELISVIDERASEFSRSLKFGNFLLCFVPKCWHQCKNQRVLLERAVERTNTFLTKAILAKLHTAS